MNGIQTIAAIPILIVGIILFWHWLILGIKECNSLFDWVSYIVVTIIGVGMIVKSLMWFWDLLFFKKEIDSPLPSVVEQKQPEPPPMPNNSTQVVEEGRGFDFGKYKQGSPEAANAYKQSSEFKENAEKLRTLDQLIKDARKQIGGHFERN